MFVARRILIITNEMKFALNVKKALERNGEYTVAVFSSGKAGVDYVRSHEQDVAVVDFRMKDMPGTDMVDHLRTLQHDIALIAAPNHPAILDLQERYNIQKIINIPTSIRKFVAALDTAKKDMMDTQNDSNKSQPLEGFSVGRSAETLEYWIATGKDGGTVLQFTASDEPPISPEANATFKQLAAEEPPMPAFADGSTIRDLRNSLRNIEEIQKTLSAISEEETAPHEVNVPQDTSSIPAAVLLGAAMDESTPIQTFTIKEFMTRANESTGGKISPLPSWERKDKKYVTEPDFLPVDLPFPDLNEAIEYTGTVTIVNPLNLDGRNPGDWTTDPIVPVKRSRPVDSDRPKFVPVEDEPDTGETSALDDKEAQEHVADMGRPAPPLPPELPDLAVSQGTERGLPFIDFNEEDAELAQLATTLTQVALELTADATVLARDGQIVGYAGKIPMSDLQGLLHEVTVEWDESGGSDKSRIVFATLPDSGAEFMVSTRGTDAGFTLSLIFSGTRPVPDIRRQSKRLIDALDAMPEIEPEPEPPVSEELQISQASIPIPTTEEIGVRTPIAYLWLRRDPNSEFEPTEQSKILESLDMELKTSGWIVGDIQAQDYVYIYGEMPATLNPRETLDELMQKTAGVIEANAKTIWDDSYLILQPGREMKTTEIQRFINFARR